MEPYEVRKVAVQARLALIRFNLVNLLLGIILFPVLAPVVVWLLIQILPHGK